MTAELFEELNDRLEAVENQRNHALKDAVILHAQLCAAKRRIAALEEQVRVFQDRETLNTLPGA